MQFQSIVITLSLAIAASALPNSPAPSPPPPVNSCSQGQTSACCDSIVNLIGSNCNAIDVLTGGSCASNQQLACCNTGPQGGVINIGSTCPNLLVPINL